VAVILSIDGKVKCCFQSDNMKRARVGWCHKGDAVPSGSLTASILCGKTPYLGEPIYGETDLQDWFGCDQSQPAREEVTRLHWPGGLLTLLFAAALPADDRYLDDEDDEEDLVESWTPRFKR